MKRFSKLISIVAGVAILTGVAIFALNGITGRTPQQDANMKAVLNSDMAQAGAGSNNAVNASVAAPASAVPAPDDDEIVSIPDGAITGKYVSPQQGIPAGPGGSAAEEDAAKAVKELYQKAVEFLQIESNEKVIRSMMSAKKTTVLDITYNSDQQQLDELAQIFYVQYLGKAVNAAVYHESGVSVSNAEGFAHIVWAYDRTGNTAARYAVTTTPGADAIVRTEITEVTVLEQDKSTVVTTTTVTTQKADGTGETKTDVSTKTLPA